MPGGRQLPLFDAQAQPSTWNERMSPGEFAVHASNSHVCDVFPTRAAAETFAHKRILEDPTLRLRVYTHEGFIGEPILNIHGTAFRGERDMSPRTRRWLGAGILGTGIILFSFDWLHDFRYDWPSVVGSRLLIPGTILVFTEWMIVLTARQKKRRAAASL